MKKAALVSGAEVAPISRTLGMSSGTGAVSIKTCLLNLSSLADSVAEADKRG